MWRAPGITPCSRRSFASRTSTMRAPASRSAAAVSTSMLRMRARASAMRSAGLFCSIVPFPAGPQTLPAEDQAELERGVGLDADEGLHAGRRDVEVGHREGIRPDHF